MAATQPLPMSPRRRSWHVPRCREDIDCCVVHCEGGGRRRWESPMPKVYCDATSVKTLAVRPYTRQQPLNLVCREDARPGENDGRRGGARFNLLLHYQGDVAQVKATAEATRPTAPARYIPSPRRSGAVPSSDADPCRHRQALPGRSTADRSVTAEIWGSRRIFGGRLLGHQEAQVPSVVLLFPGGMR